MSEHVHRALIVEDDVRIVEEVRDRLDSLGHTYDCAATQLEARQRLAGGKYCYILLDLEIPVRPKSMPRIDSGQNLLEEIRREGINRQTPVIIMTGHGTDGYDLAVEMMKRGANDYVGKPFAPGSSPRSLTSKIKEALERGCECRPSEGVASAEAATAEKPRGEHPAGAKPFQGSELVFYPNRVELLGEKILGPSGPGITRRVLDALSEHRGGRYATYSGEVLARKVGADGQNAVSGCIKNLRKTIRKVLQKKGFACERNDVIESGSRGYHLNTWMTVRRLDE
ncbi:MAG TPA: response regulator [Planctomycetota bacterium]|nr:response regulator [Planctomycetota bacterium]HRR82265.1 response regulator [Planctomycetota bacterium]HRT94221.1 response regulator [Planctomycetota bacterium]